MPEENDYAARMNDILGDDAPIGIEQLDLDDIGGIPHGSVVAILADPRSIGEFFGYHLARTGPTKYLTTVRPDKAIKTDFDNFGPTDGVPDDVDIVDARNAPEDTDSVIENEFNRNADNSYNFVIDTFSHLSDSQYFERIARRIYTAASATDGITYLLFTHSNDDQLSRAEEDVIHMCDAVFDVNTEVRGDNIYHTLAITKLRGKSLPEETVRLECTDALAVNRTQNVNS